MRHSILNKWMGFLVALFIVSGSIYMIHNFVVRLKKQEAAKVENFATVQKLLITSDENTSSEALKFYINFVNTMNIPLIVVDEKGNYIDSKNIDEEVIKNSKKLKKLMKSMADEYQPLIIQLPTGNQKIYFKNSELLDQLHYYPIIFIIIAALFGLFTYWYYQTVKYSEQSLLWAGMAKETAHQIGTPLSSLLGWIELLKTEKLQIVDAIEMEKDINRLNTIAERFSKIGSVPELKPENVVQITYQNYEYLKNRLSKNVEFTFHCTEQKVIANISVPLYNWVIENLVKNAVDAMKGKGSIHLSIWEKNDKIIVSIKDSGAGIKPFIQKRIFEPGFTTKTRGWGLGLSLAKRIIENYHKGKIYVHKSEIGKGTEFRIIFYK